MPKLSQKQVTTIKNTEPQFGGGGFTILPKGDYIGTLTNVEASTSRNGNPIWNLEWSDIKSPEGEEYPGRQFFTLNFPTSAKRPADWNPGGNSKKDLDTRWSEYQDRCKAQIAGFFAAHGYTPDTDTDEMISDGAQALLSIEQETQQQGQRAGQLRNVVRGFSPLDEETAAAADAGEPDGDDDEF